MRGLPAPLAAADPRVVRPRDLAAVWAQPAKELRALALDGALVRLAHGYYAVVPEQVRHLDGWRPTVEGAALAIAQVDYGPDDVALMGISAARVLGVVPRAVGTAVVAVPAQRRPMETAAGTVVFVKRRVGTLATRQVTTDLAEGLCTNREQTLLDLEDRPTLGGLDAADVDETKRRLAAEADVDRLADLGRRLRKRSAADRAAEFVA